MTRSRKVAAFLVYIVLAIGCREAVIPAVKEDPSEIKEPKTRERTHGDTFSKLKLLFPHRMLDEKFQTLRELTATRTYLDFLSQEYPAEKPFQTFDAFLETAPPDSQRYFPFLKEFIENPTAEDITLLHQITQGYRNANAVQHHFFFHPNPDALHIHTVMEKKITIMENKAVQNGLNDGFRPERYLPSIFYKLSCSQLKISSLRLKRRMPAGYSSFSMNMEETMARFGSPSLNRHSPEKS